MPISWLVMTFFVYKGLTRNPEIRSTLVWVLPNIWKLGQVRDNKIWVKDIALRLANSILGHNSGTRILPDMGLKLFPGKTKDNLFK